MTEPTQADPTNTEPTIVQDLDPREPDMAAIRDALAAFNVAATGVRDYWPVAFYVRDEADAIVGGLLGGIWGKRLTIDYLWLAENLRGRGLGGRLMERAEAYARAKGCVLAHLDTFNFQAGPDWYQRRGCRVFGELASPEDGWRNAFMVKDLSAPSSPTERPAQTS